MTPPKASAQDEALEGKTSESPKVAKSSSSKPSNGTTANNEGSQPIKIDLPLMSIEEVMHRMLNRTAVPDEPTGFEDLVNKTRELLDPLFGNLLRDSVTESNGLGVLKLTMGDLSAGLTEKQKNFIAFLFDDRADRIVQKRKADMKAVREQIRTKTNDTMKLPDSEEARVFLFFNTSEASIQYLGQIQMMIVMNGCAPERFYSES